MTRIVFTACFVLIYNVIFLDGINSDKNHTKYVRNYDISDQIPIDNVFGYYLLDIASDISTRLRDVSNDELGVTVVQEIYDSLEYSIFPHNDSEKVVKMIDKLTSKLKPAVDILRNMRDIVLQHGSKIRTAIYPCPPDSPQPSWDFQPQYNQKEIEIMNLVNYATAGDLTEESPNITKVFAEHLNGLPQFAGGIKQQYFLSTADSVTSPGCFHYDESRLRALHMKSMQPSPKYVLVMIDHGNSLSNIQLETAKAVAKYVIDLLTTNDYVGVISLAQEFQVPNDLCQPQTKNQNYTLRKATNQNKENSIRFVEGLFRSKESTNHSLGFQKAFDILQNSLPENYTDENVMVLYISRGLLSSIAEARTVLETIALGQQNLQYPIVINTCAVTPDAKKIMYEKDFLRDVAVQNFSKYNINISQWMPVQRSGIMQPINSSVGVGQVSTAFYSTLITNETIITDEIKVHLPYWDPVSKDLTVTLTIGCDVFGVAGIDLYLSDLVEDVTYFSTYPFTYAFIIDKQGITIMHPSFPRPIVANEAPFPTDIIHLETHSEFEEIRKLLLAEDNGKYIINNVSNDINSTITYTWKWSMGIYCTCIVSVENEKRPARVHQVVPHSNLNQGDCLPELLHHRIDLIPPTTGSLCRHLKQIVTLDTGTLYLSASSFQSPFSYLRSNRASDDSLHSVQSYMAYIKDNTRLLANPGLLSEIRNDVAALLHVLTYLKRQHMHGPLKKYVVRRYVATTSGVLEVFPGCILEPDLEPNRRPWFVRAMEHPGKVVLTEPYLDAGGSGYIVSLSHTIFEGKAAALHSAHDSTIAVMGMDLTLGFFYKLLLDSAPFCAQPNIKCFLMDDKGYLISHPSLIDPNSKGPFERQHITHKESLVANDILNHKGLVKKQLCNNFADRTMQRYYQFNTSLSGVLTNVVHGEHCVKYQVTALSGTNIFLGLVNSSCDGGAFCPCSTVDRLCLNCNRMEQNECECPCECPLDLDQSENQCYRTSATDLNKSIAAVPICSANTEQSVILGGPLYHNSLHLKSCIHFNCELHTSHSDCLGVLGCEWCRIDADGETVLTTPFCTSQTTCFGGVLGSVTPYGDGPFGTMAAGDLHSPVYPAIGPVAGAVVALCLILAVAVYCYRQNMSQIGAAEQLYGDSNPEHCGMRMSRLNCDDINDDDIDHQDMLLQKSDAIGPTSPYRVSTGYRRPPPTADSDHGYSTMTPHDESEHLCFALAEPLIIINNKDVSSLSDTGSINTSVSTPRHNNRSKIDDESITKLPNIHQVLASVTVHRIMETT